MSDSHDHDRRAARLEIPPCPMCAGADVRVTVRMEFVLYLRCWSCGWVWSIPKPGIEGVE